MANDLKDHTYLGDDVYAGHDGYQIWLMLGSHDSTPLIALDAQCLAALDEYRLRLKAMVQSP